MLNSIQTPRPATALLTLFAALPVALGSLATPAFSQAVIRTGPTANDDATSLTGALQLAAPGDTILVTGDIAFGIVTIDKPVRVIFDTGVFEPLQFRLVIRDILAGDEIYIEGLDILSDFGGVPGISGMVNIENCAGTVWISNMNSPGLSVPAITAIDSNVVLSRCSLSSFSGSPFGGPGVVARNSTITMHESSTQGAGGSPGVSLDNSTLTAIGCSLFGGFGPFDTAAPGLDLIHGSSATLRDTIAAAAPSPFVPPGTPGTQTDATSSVTILAGPSHSLDATAIAREGQPVDYNIAGPAGDLIALTYALGLASPPTFFDLLNGTLILDSTLVAVPVGALPATGVLVVETVLSDLGPGTDVTTLFVQVLALDVVGAQAYSGGIQGLTLLDSSF